MKKILSVLSIILVFSLLCGGTVFASETDYDTIAEWDIMIAVPEELPAMYDGINFYIYTQNAGSIPYVMVKAYDGFGSEEEFIYDYFTEYMGEQYADLEVMQDLEPVVIGGRDYYEIYYGYSVQGHPVTDHRLIKTVGEKTYMFTSKEVEELDMFVGSLLEEEAAACIYLRDGEPIDEQELGKGGGEDGDYPVVNWSDVEAEVEEEGIEGEFYKFDEIGFEMFLPSFMSPAEIPSGQMAADTFIGFFLNDAGDSYAAVQYLPADLTLDIYTEFVIGLEGTEDVTDFMVNGNHFIFYVMPEADSMSLATYAQGGIIEFTFCPISEDFGMYAEIMGASIREAK